MAEVGIIASALQIADIGVRLSLRLYTFGETVASADKSIIAISEHVSLTSTVLKELGQTLDKDQTSRICSPNAVQTADSIVKQCQRIFQEIDHVLVKKLANTKSMEKDRKIKAAQTLERLKWPFIKGKIDLLMSNLEKQKSTLILMLNVIALAKQGHERTEPHTIIAEQRSLIEDLARSNEGYIRKFERLRLNCEETPINEESDSGDWSSSMPTPTALTAYGLASTLPVDAPGQRESSADANGLDREPYKGSDIPSFSSSDRLGWLLQQYDNLMRKLLREVSAPTYEIAEESRSRIRADIVSTKRREMETLNQAYYTNRTSSQTVHEYSRSKVDVDQKHGPALVFCTDDGFTGEAAYGGYHYELARRTLDPESPTSNISYSEESSSRQTRKRRSMSSTLQPETSLEGPIPQWGNDSSNPRSSKRSRTSKVEAYAGPATTNEDHPAIQSGASDVETIFDEKIVVDKEIADEKIPKKKIVNDEHEKIAHEKIFNKQFEDDGMEDYAEHIVDKLLATWTTLPLHASQTNFRHGSLAEAAH